MRTYALYGNNKLLLFSLLFLSLSGVAWSVVGRIVYIA